MKLSWNAQKNKMIDVKGKEMEQENVVSAKVQMDEIAPHMHPYFIPVNRQAVNEIHNELTGYLCQHSFDVERGQTKKDKTYFKDIHEYKEKAHVLSDLDQQIDMKKYIQLQRFGILKNKIIS